MKRLIANWKLNMTEKDIKHWFDIFYSSRSIDDSVDIIVAPSTIYLPIVYRYAALGKVRISSQDVSVYEEGAYTGEVSAAQVKEYAQFAIIGHSERRAMGESLDIVSTKIIRAQENNLIPIICFSSIPEYIKAEKAVDKQKQHFFAFEPIDSIGTRNPASLQSIQEICTEIGLMKVIYGGSVDFDSIVAYLDSPIIEGFLVGSASLDPEGFYNIARILSTYLPK